jgi:hypothetical protein
LFRKAKDRFQCLHFNTSNQSLLLMDFLYLDK